MLISGNTLLAQSDSEANRLCLEVGDLTDRSYSSTVKVKQGKCGELADYCEIWADVSTGAISLLISSYESLSANLEDDIYDEEARLDSFESHLTRKYAVLDETLSYYANLESQLSSTLSQLEWHCFAYEKRWN